MAKNISATQTISRQKSKFSLERRAKVFGRQIVAGKIDYVNFVFRSTDEIRENTETTELLEKATNGSIFTVNQLAPGPSTNKPNFVTLTYDVVKSTREKKSYLLRN